ncbi:mas-related G-protein coupled receptor member X3-like [Suncus etruscus]|uniref:mas-related G-protein coupled receptor member X3-like n=1 Tax=Suncus etruscus TaxID=109475 RepID=UPI00210F4A57|nr:mas-related G-protein coupled receptor member X3-like [Suncus etruscus]
MFITEHNRTDVSSYYEVLMEKVILIFPIILCLCGLVGNGMVIWLLGFCMKRNHFSVYILNLAVADFTFLLSAIMWITAELTLNTGFLFRFANTLCLSSYSVGLILLITISIERCVSVLWPLWYKCHHAEHLSTIVCALIWALFHIFILIIYIFSDYKIKDVSIVCYIYGFITLPAFLVLFVSNLTLFIRVHCFSQQRNSSRAYWTILLNVLVFLLLSVPNGVYMVCEFFMEKPLFTSEILIFNTLCTVNSSVNPIIYFFIGRYRQQGGRKRLQEVLQRALTDENDEAEQRRGRPSFQTEHDIP